MKQKTVAEMTQEGYAKYPRYVYSNSLYYDEDCNRHPNPAQFWHKIPTRYELVYRGGQYIYVPVGDKKSSEARGGDWTYAFEGLNLDSYAGNFSFAFVNSQTANEMQKILIEVVKNYTPKQFSNYENISLCRAVVDYIEKTKTSALKYLPDYQKVLKEWKFSRCSINSALKPYYRLDDKDKLVPFNSEVANSGKIARYQKSIAELKEKIAKFEKKIEELV